MTSRESKSIVFKSDRCIGCYSCVVSCMDQNDLDVARDDLSWRIVENVPGRLVGKHRGNASVSIACMHCEDAACIAACPAGAIARRCRQRCPCWWTMACASAVMPARWPVRLGLPVLGVAGRCRNATDAMPERSSGWNQRVSGTARPTRSPTNRSTPRWTRKRPAQPGKLV